MKRLATLALVLVTVTATGCAQGLGDDPGTGTGDPGAGDPGGGTGGGGSTGGGGGGGGSSLPGCKQDVSINLAVKALAPDVLLVVDRSSSMAQPITPSGFDQKWTMLTGAIDTLLDQYTSTIDFGLMLFAQVGDTCGAGVVNVGPKAGSGSTIKEVLDTFGNGPGGGTPTSASLHNALTYFQNHPVNPYGRYIILTTDGVPACEQDPVTNTLAALRDLRNAGINTYVMGIATDSAADVLNQMAQAGGTSSYYPVESASDLSAALGGITSTVTEVSCDYTVDTHSDPAALVVDVGGQQVPRSEDHSDGWDFDPDSQTLSFYGDACDQLKALGSGQINVTWCTLPD